jgi:hypothetical protein
MDHADDCLIYSRERKAAMRSFGPTAGSRADLLGDWAENGFAMMSILSARPFRRVALAAVISLALVFVTTASAEVPASARRIRVKRSVPTEFVGPPADQPLTAFKCYWVDPAAQYLRNSNRSKLGDTAELSISTSKELIRTLVCKS